MEKFITTVKSEIEKDLKKTTTMIRNSYNNNNK